MLVTVPSAILRGVTAHPVHVEVHLTAGLPGFTVIGTPDAECREARDRVRAAIISSRYRWPRTRITVNLTPSGLPKSGATLDLAIAVGILAADRQLDPERLTAKTFYGELSLDGSLRPVRGALPLVEAADPTTTVVVPPGNLPDARAAGHPDVRAALTLAQLGAALEDRSPWLTTTDATVAPDALAVPDLAEVRADGLTVLALEAAAAGGHHVLLVGPDDAATTLLARLAVSLVPAPTPGEALEIARVRSAARLPHTTPTGRPFRAPHHSRSTVGMVGGGWPTLAPGELSLAHGGALFLDELPEHPTPTLDAIAHALNCETVRVARGDHAVELPARFQLIAAMAPCPGYHPPGPCTCPAPAVARYHRRIPPRLLDRLTIRVPVGTGAPLADRDTATAAARVATARSHLATTPHPGFTPDAAALLDRHHRAGALSTGGRTQVAALAHTIAALDDQHGPLDLGSLALALQLHPTPHQLTTPNPAP